MHEFFLFGHTLIFANIRLSFFAGESFNREQKKNLAISPSGLFKYTYTRGLIIDFLTRFPNLPDAHFHNSEASSKSASPRTLYRL